MNRTITFILCLLLTLAIVPASMASGEIPITVSPETLGIGTTYNGTSVRVTGKVPADSDVIIRMTGAPSDLHMKRKGKVLGVLWMNMDSVTFDGVPKLYLLGSTRPLSELGEPGTALLPENNLKDIAIEPDSGDRTELIHQLISLKTHETLYQENATTIAMSPAQDGLQPFEAELSVPSNLTPGQYTVDVFAVKDGAVTTRSTKPLEVRLVSMPSFMSRLAFDHGLLYGVLATIIAILSGLLVGFVFKDKGGAH